MGSKFHLTDKIPNIENFVAIDVKLTHPGHILISVE